MASRVFAVVLVFFVPRFADRGAIVLLQSARPLFLSSRLDTQKFVEASSSFCRWSFFFFFFALFFARRAIILTPTLLLLLLLLLLFIVLRTIQSFRRLSLSLFFRDDVSASPSLVSLSLPRKKKAPRPSSFSLVVVFSVQTKSRESLSREKKKTTTRKRGMVCFCVGQVEICQ